MKASESFVATRLFLQANYQRVDVTKRLYDKAIESLKEADFMAVHTTWQATPLQYFALSYNWHIN